MRLTAIKQIDGSLKFVRPDSIKLKPGEEIVGVRDMQLGDAITLVTTKLGIQQCGGCHKRQVKLNKVFNR